MPNFHTIYDPAETKNKDKVYDIHDNVDRISYVDSTRLVERFILEGANLNAARAKALRSGLYSGDMDEILNDDGIVLPVYSPDRAEIDPVIDMAKRKYASDVAVRKTTISNDDSSEATPSPNNGVSDGVEK